MHPQKKIIFEEINVKNKAHVNRAFNSVKRELGAIDIVINGAAVINEKDIKNTIEVNILGVVHCTKAALRHLAVENEGEGGIVGNIASVFGLDTLFSAPVYAASGHAVVGYTASLSDNRLEDKFGVKFVTMCPGFTDTPMIDYLEKVIVSEDLAEATGHYAKGKGLQTYPMTSFF